MIILLAIIAALAIWTYHSSGDGQSGAPDLTPLRVIMLVVVGFIAGVLGGLIGTGGCSIMLPAIHFWMGYSAPLAIGITIFAVIFTAISGGYGHLVHRNLDRKAVFIIMSSVPPSPTVPTYPPSLQNSPHHSSFLISGDLLKKYLAVILFNICIAFDGEFWGQLQ